MNLSVLLKFMDGCWMAVSLERFILSCGETEKEAIDGFCELLASEIAYGYRHGNPAHPLDGIPPAPAPFWDDADRASVSEGSPNTMTVLLVEEGQKKQKIELQRKELGRLAA